MSNAPESVWLDPATFTCEETKQRTAEHYARLVREGRLYD